MKNRIISICMVLVIFGTILSHTILFVEAATTASGRVGNNLRWELKNGVLTISGSGEMCDFYTKPTSESYGNELSAEMFSDYTTSPWSPYQEEIVFVIIRPGVTSVGQMTFYFCENLLDVSLPDSVEYIKELAFLGCDSLENINCPSKLKEIEKDTFGERRQLTIKIPADFPTNVDITALKSCER